MYFPDGVRTTHYATGRLRRRMVSINNLWATKLVNDKPWWNWRCWT